MGMYTMLALNAIVKPEYRDCEQAFLWGEWKELAYHDELTEHKEVIAFLKDSRNSMIPKGWSSYFDQDDNYIAVIATDNEPRFDSSTGSWQAFCSLKNYEDTIEKFLAIAPLILQEGVFQIRYEEAETSTFYQLRNGELVQICEEVAVSLAESYWR